MRNIYFYLLNIIKEQGEAREREGERGNNTWHATCNIPKSLRMNKNALSCCKTPVISERTSTKRGGCVGQGVCGAFWLRR